MTIKGFKSLTFKLTIWYILILGILVVLAGLFLYQGFREGLVDDLDKILLEIADETYEKWRRKRGVTWKEAIQHTEERYSSHSPFIQVVEMTDKEHQVEEVLRSDRIPDGTFLLNTRLYCKADKSDIEDLVFITVEESRLSPLPLRVILLPVRGDRILQVGISLKNITEASSQLLMVMVAAGLMLLFLASLGGSFIINKALRPVKSTVQTAQKITADDLSLRIDIRHRKDEIGRLVETFNDMIARLEKSVKKIRQFSGDVSHELRTPLTIIRGEIEVLLRKERKKEEYIKILNSVLEESRRMETIIDDLLFLSRVEALDKSQLDKTVPLEDVLDRAVESRRPSAVKRGIELICKKVEAVRVKGAGDLLERMVTNLIDNAIRYTSKGGLVEVSLDKIHDAVNFEIRDTGIGIPEESLPHIFDRFYVVDKSRSKETGGSGLGLSIVKWVAESHGADITVQSEVNKGTSFLISFPAA